MKKTLLVVIAGLLSQPALADTFESFTHDDVVFKLQAVIRISDSTRARSIEAFDFSYKAPKRGFSQYLRTAYQLTLNYLGPSPFVVKKEDVEVSQGNIILPDDASAFYSVQLRRTPSGSTVNELRLYPRTGAIIFGLAQSGSENGAFIASQVSAGNFTASFTKWSLPQADQAWRFAAGVYVVNSLVHRWPEAEFEILGNGIVILRKFTIPDTAGSLYFVHTDENSSKEVRVDVQQQGPRDFKITVTGKNGATGSIEFHGPDKVLTMLEKNKSIGRLMISKKER